MEKLSPICRNCGVENRGAPDPEPGSCEICNDDRQYLDPNGQKWIYREALTDFTIQATELEPDAYALKTEPVIGIGHTSYLLNIGDGWLLWDPLPITFRNQTPTPRIQQALHNVSIAASHPHMFGAQSHWAVEYNGTVLVNELDLKWSNEAISRKVVWRKEVDLSPRAKLVELGGHFPGSSILVWKNSSGGTWLFSSDTAQVRPNGHFAFMWSYPNLLPLGRTEVDRMVDRFPPTNASKAFDNFGRSVTGDIDNIFRLSAQNHNSHLV